MERAWDLSLTAMRRTESSPCYPTLLGCSTPSLKFHLVCKTVFKELVILKIFKSVCKFYLFQQDLKIFEHFWDSMLFKNFLSQVGFEKYHQNCFIWVKEFAIFGGVFFGVQFKINKILNAWYSDLYNCVWKITTWWNINNSINLQPRTWTLISIYSQYKSFCTSKEIFFNCTWLRYRR